MARTVEELVERGLVEEDIYSDPEVAPPEEDAVPEELQNFVQRAAEEALNWRDEELDPQQEEATDYYMGRPFGNEEEGRSKVVSTDVRDTVQAILPSLMRIFFGPEQIVEYEPMGPEDVEGAEQATDSVNHVVRNDNQGFSVIHSAFKDALVRKLGIIKWWWEDNVELKGYQFTDLTDEHLMMLQQEEGVTVEVTGQYEGGGYEATVTRKVSEGRAKIAAVPPEEFIFSPSARSLEDAELVGHVREVPASELIAMGIDSEIVESKKGSRPSTSNAAGRLESARRFDRDERNEEFDEESEAREGVWFAELYVYFDVDGDDIAELVKVICVGDDYEVVDFYPCDVRPFALFCPDPEPHTLVGLSMADYTMDVQLIKSGSIRGMLDSLSLTINPRTEIVEGEVNIEDIMNPEVGGITRVTRPGMIRESVTPFVGKEVLPVLSYMDEIRENRTGISKAAAGLNADALQSATKSAVAATLTGAQQHIELLARIFAETGMRQLYVGLLKLLVQHQDQARLIRMRNKFVPMDPASWNADMDVRINLALGGGSSEEKLQMLMLIAAEQKEQIQQGSPLVTLVEYRRTLAQLVELAGFPNPQAFFRPFGEQEQQQYEQQKQQQPPQDPQMAAIEMQQKIEQAKLELDRQEMLLKDQRERAKMEMDFAIKQANIEAQYSVQLSNAELQADVQGARAVMETDAKVREAKEKAKLQAQQAQQQGPAGPVPRQGGNG